MPIIIYSYHDTMMLPVPATAWGFFYFEGGYKVVVDNRYKGRGNIDILESGKEAAEK